MANRKMRLAIEKSKLHSRLANTVKNKHGVRQYSFAEPAETNEVHEYLGKRT